VPAGRREGVDLILDVRVQPRASRSELAGLYGDRLRIRLHAPPVDGRANAALVEFVAATFGVPRAQVVIEHGLAGRDKRLRLRAAPRVAAHLQALVGCD